jgi:hypothetical protein
LSSPRHGLPTSALARRPASPRPVHHFDNTHDVDALSDGKIVFAHFHGDEPLPH